MDYEDDDEEEGEEVQSISKRDTKGTHSNHLTHQNKFGVTSQLTSPVWMVVGQGEAQIRHEAEGGHGHPRPMELFYEPVVSYRPLTFCSADTELFLSFIIIID